MENPPIDILALSMYALEQNDIRAVSQFLQIYRAEDDIEAMYCLLNISVFSNNIEMITLIIKYLTIDELNDSQDDYVYMALSEGNSHALELLIEHGLEIHQCNEIFVDVAAHGDVDILKILCEKFEYEECVVHKALEKASRQGHFNTVKFLIDVCYENDSYVHGEAVDAAISKGHLRTAKYLIRDWVHGFDYIKEDDYIFLYACLNGNDKFLRWFTKLLNIAENENVDIDTDNLDTKDINMNSKIITKFRKLRRLNINIMQHDVLVYCCGKGHIDGVKYLISQGVNIHADYEYALRLAFWLKNFDIVNYLILNGANLEIAIQNLDCEEDKKNLSKFKRDLFRGTLDNKTEIVCYICHEDMNIDQELIIQCKVCNKCVHLTCQNKWKPECVFCRH